MQNLRIVVFAHTPPPHHGQSYMVELMLSGLGGDLRKQARHARQLPASAIQCFHVNARISDDMADVGRVRVGKICKTFAYCLEAISVRFRYGADVLYYVPAPAKRGALYRDWLVMLLCRPFFRKVVLHWHASGLAEWLQREGSTLETWTSQLLLGRADLGIALSTNSRHDAEWFRSKQIAVVPNGIPDPAPDYDDTLGPTRAARMRMRQRLANGEEPLSGDLPSAEGQSEHFRVLFLAHCMRSKGLFDTLGGVALANKELRRVDSPLRICLTVAGVFVDPAEESEFLTRIKEPGLSEPAVEYAGFVAHAQKMELLRECDCLCFPSFYPAEGQPVSVLEAMAAGQAVIATRWRGLPKTLPPNYPFLVEPQAPPAIAAALLNLTTCDVSAELRAHFLSYFTVERFTTAIAKVLVECV